MACHIHKKQKIILLLPEGQGITEAAGIHALVLTQGFMSMWVYIYMYATKFIGCLPMEIAGLNYTCSNWSSAWLWIGHASTLFDLFGFILLFFPNSSVPISIVSPLLWNLFSAASMCIPGRESFMEWFEVSLSTSLPCIEQHWCCGCGKFVSLSLWWWEESQCLSLFFGINPELHHCLFSSVFPWTDASSSFGTAAPHPGRVISPSASSSHHFLEELWLLQGNKWQSHLERCPQYQFKACSEVHCCHLVMNSDSLAN